MDRRKLTFLYLSLQLPASGRVSLGRGFLRLQPAGPLELERSEHLFMELHEQNLRALRELRSGCQHERCPS